jgi:hypothetical protein
MRREPLVGAGVGAVIVGYFTSTEPNLSVSIILGAIFLALTFQLTVIAVPERGARPTARSLAYVVGAVASVQTLFSFWRLLAGENVFSIVGVICGLCFLTVARAALQQHTPVQPARDFSSR